MKLDLSPITNAYQRLSSRERRLLQGAIGVMVAIAFYSLVWQPLQDSQVELAKRIQAKQRDLIEMQQMRDAYLDLMNQFELRQKIIEKADPKFSLFPHIESTVSQVLGGRDKIASMNPQNKDLGGAYREESVELKLNGVSLQQLEDLLYHIEKGAEPLRLTRLQVKKRARDPQTFDVTATVSMLKALDAGKGAHAAEKVPEQPTGQSPEQPSGQAPEQATGQAPAQASGQSPEQPREQAAEHAPDKAPEQGAGQAPPPAPEQAPKPAPAAGQEHA